MRNATTFVTKGDLEMAVALRCGDLDFPGPSRLLYGIVSVVQDIQEDLLQLMRISQRDGKIFLITLAKLDAVIREVIRPKPQRLAHDRVHLNRLALRRHLPRKTEQVVYNDARALRLLKDDAQFLFSSVRNSWVLEQQVGEPHDRSQWIVYFVRDAGDQLTQSGHFFGAHQLRLQVHGIGNIGHDNDNAVDLALLIAHWAQAHRKEPLYPVPSIQGNFQIVGGNTLERALKRFCQNRTARRGNQFRQRIPHKIGLTVTGFKASPVRVADKARRVEHEDHALRVIENVPVEIALPAITPLGLPAIGDVLQYVDRPRFAFAAPTNPGAGNEIGAVRRCVDVLFELRPRIPAKRA